MGQTLLYDTVRYGHWESLDVCTALLSSSTVPSGRRKQSAVSDSGVMALQTWEVQLILLSFMHDLVNRSTCFVINLHFKPSFIDGGTPS